MADSLKKVMAYFGLNASQMVKEWKLLSDQDKADIRQGLEDGSLTY